MMMTFLIMLRGEEWRREERRGGKRRGEHMIVLLEDIMKDLSIHNGCVHHSSVCEVLVKRDIHPPVREKAYLLDLLRSS